VKNKYYEIRYANFCIFILRSLSSKNFSSVFYLHILLLCFSFTKRFVKWVVNISVFLFVNVKRRTEDSELVLNIHTYVHTYTHTYVHTYIRTHIHTYIHTYIYIHNHRSKSARNILTSAVLFYRRRSQIFETFCFSLLLSPSTHCNVCDILTIVHVQIEISVPTFTYEWITFTFL